MPSFYLLTYHTKRLELTNWQLAMDDSEISYLKQDFAQADRRARPQGAVRSTEANSRARRVATPQGMRPY